MRRSPISPRVGSSDTLPALNAEILYLFFNSANMNRWNDHMRPVDLTELDKQAHKAAIAWVLAKFEESAGNPIDWRLVIEHTMFSFIQRAVLTDLKPQVFHRITSERRGPVNDYVLSEFDRLVPDSDPGFRSRFAVYLSDPKSTPEDAVIRYISRAAASAEAEGKKTGIIAADETAPLYRQGIVRSIGSRQDEEEIARHLYGVLRDFDSDGADVIYSEAFYTPRMGQAIMNRLLKAAGHKIIHITEEEET